MVASTSIKHTIRLAITGFAMGAADLIPGVSGGTIAFLSGIYEELITAIKTVTGKTLQLLLSGKIKEAISTISFSFLIPLVVGIGTAIITLSSALSYLLKYQPIPIWSFFFGLILMSVYVVLKRVVRWDLSDKASFALAAVGAYILVGSVPVETPATPLMFFLSGMIAISAMILPGISGSFILLLLGKYSQVLAAVTERDFLTLGMVAAGCALGLALFSRVLSWLFSNHHDISVAVLAGFMLGSMRRIWPWREPLVTRINSHGEIVPIVERNILPQALDMSVALALLLAIVGAFAIYRLDKMHATREHTHDLKDKAYPRRHKEALKEQGEKPSTI